MQRINRSEQQIAEWLEQRAPYPDLRSDPGHALDKRITDIRRIYEETSC